MWSKLNICFTTISDPEQQYVLLWLNTVTAVQMFFIERIFVSFMTLFLKKVWIIISASKPHCHSIFSKPILKILSIYKKNTITKQLSEAICSKYVFKLLHAPKFKVFSTKLNMMIKAVRLFTGVLWKSCSDKFYGKTPMRQSLF